MEPNELQREHEDYRTFQADGGEGVLSWATEGMVFVVKIKHKSNLLELSTVSDGDLLAGPAIPGLGTRRSKAAHSSF